jgi:ABC-2 type transport system permease protein
VRVALAHTRATLLGLGRYPAFAVPTLLLPTLFFVLFALPNGHVPHRMLTASFAAFAVFSVVFFQFGVGIAGERETAWETYLRTLPVSVRARMAARVLAASAFSAVGCGLLLATAAATGYARFGAGEWGRFLLALAGGAVPIALMGIALGYWVPPRGALPVANVVYLLFSFAGGLWSGPRELPSVVRALSPLLPTRQWADVLWPAVLGQPWQARHWLALLGFACGFGLLAGWGYRRDEGQRFR